ncbi:YitT family protein [Fibrisoma montanum]|uniref:YitT family protein n=1 Tax=Fibrisoma montanum TaxID=2305895 RepID=A0A418LY71_9BACT|nr:YitT family protein [Fibrisoma montanum]RIV18157.1 YitT family protein [Fibrisoma montanum]
MVSSTTHITSTQTQLRWLKDLGFLSAGVLCAGMGLKGFLLPNNFLDGGAMGISLLLELVTGVELAFLVILVNIPFIWMGFRQISPGFAMRTVVAIGLLAICLVTVPYPVVTSDKLLISVFGGFFLGAGIGLAIRGGGVLDGTEVLAIYVSRRSALTVGDVIMVINILVFGAAAMLTNIETALYAMLTYLAASKTIDFLIHGIEEYTAVLIISDEHEAIRQMITEDMGRGVTVFKGEKGYGKRGHRNQDTNIIYAVVTRLELTRLKDRIGTIDDQAFIVNHGVDDAKGGMVKGRPLH